MKNGFDHQHDSSNVISLAGARKQAKAANEKLTDALGRERERVRQLEEQKRKFVQKL